MLADDGIESMADAYLAFGGNIGEVKPRILAAWEMLGQSPIISVAARSQLYRTAPVGGPPGQSDYINAACRVRTTASARELLQLCLGIEARVWPAAGRALGSAHAGYRSAALRRPEHHEPGLIVPHPRLRERLFALVPLADVAAPGLLLPPNQEPLQGVIDASYPRERETIAEWRRRVFV